jgi:hypothetical protein
MLLNTLNDEHVSEPRITERWFRSRLDLPTAESKLYHVIEQLYPGVYIEGPRMRIPSGPFMGSWRRPDFAASLITGRMRRGQRTLPDDAHVEVRLYGEQDGTTVLIGISALGQDRPWRIEERMLTEFALQWESADPSLTQEPSPGYAI